MNKLSKHSLAALILLLAVSHNTWSQRLDYEDKLFFADSVKKIKVWTYLEGDKKDILSILLNIRPGKVFPRRHGCIRSSTG
jgi:hypothetical protein